MVRSRPELIPRLVVSLRSRRNLRVPAASRFRDYAPAAAMLPKMLQNDLKRAGWSVGRAAWELGVSIREYRELEAGTRSPSFETRERIRRLYGLARVASPESARGAQRLFAGGTFVLRFQVLTAKADTSRGNLRGVQHVPRPRNR